MTIIFGSLNPVRLVDEATDGLGALLIDGVRSLSFLVKDLTTLPAGFQVVIALVGSVCLGSWCTLRSVRSKMREASGVASAKQMMTRPKRKQSWPR